MAGNLGLWRVDAEQPPRRLNICGVDLERRLENWIERDPALLEAGLTIVGRQIWLQCGPLDLLALDPQGRWILVEIKRERLRRDVIAQAIDYASCLASMAFDQLRGRCDEYLAKVGRGKTLAELLTESGGVVAEAESTREIIVYVVGVGRDPGLDRMVDYLGRNSGLTIRIVTFDVFSGEGDAMIMVRELHETVSAGDEQRPRTASSVEEALGRAKQQGVGEVVDLLHAAALEHGLIPRSYGTSIRYAPPANKTRCIFTVWMTPEKSEAAAVNAWFEPTGFDQFYGVPEERFREVIGEPGYRLVDRAEAGRLIEAIELLLASKSERA